MCRAKLELLKFFGVVFSGYSNLVEPQGTCRAKLKLLRSLGQDLKGYSNLVDPQGTFGAKSLREDF